MMSTRFDANADTVLSQIRDALAQSILPDTAGEHPTESVPRVRTEDQEDMISAFERELDALSGRLHIASTRSEATEIVLQLVKEYSADTILSWSSEMLPLAGIREQLANAGVTIIESTASATDEDRARSMRTKSRAQMGLTGAQAGLADTGSIVLVSGPGRPRSASLLPPVHVALLSIDDLFASLNDVFNARPELVQMGSNIVVITGPSRTADIELTLTIGVHGPSELHVVLLPRD
jgi:L-lactate dehydrogenase complex protein LldG